MRKLFRPCRICVKLKADRSRSPTHKSHPDSYCGEFDEGEVVGVVFFEAGGDGSEVFELVEEAFDEISKAVEIGTERGDVDAPWHGFDVGPGPSFVEGLAQGVAVDRRAKSGPQRGYRAYR